MGWNLPPGCTDRHIDEACPGYWDNNEDEQEESKAMDTAEMKQLLAAMIDDHGLDAVQAIIKELTEESK